MSSRPKTKRTIIMGTSPWILLGATAILLIFVIVMAVQNTNREKRHMSEVLSAKGAALIRAVEAGARTGMLGMKWGSRHLQRLLEETARLPDVLYMAIVNEHGVIVAHSDASKVDTEFDLNSNHSNLLDPEKDEQWEVVTIDSETRAFEIRRHFRPLFPPGRMGFGRMGGMMREHPFHPPFPGEWFDSEAKAPLFIVAGLDTGPFESAIQQDIRTTMVLSAILLLLGMGGFISLFWMHSYRSATQSLQDTSAFADNVVASLPVGLIAMDRLGRVTFFNETAGQITGIPPSEALGQSPAELLPDNLNERLSDLERSGSIREHEMECSFPSGPHKPLSISATRIVNTAGDLVGHVLILRDLEELRRLQDAMRRQEKLAAIGGLAAGVAHEIRNPLSSIKGLAAFFADRLKDDMEAEEAAGVMTQEVDRLNRAITELLDFARPTDLNARPADLAPVIHRAVQLVQQDALNQGIAIHTEVEESLCSVHIDPDRMAQCLLNLFLNAIQAMEDGGTLTIQCRSRNQNSVTLTVSDTGLGIAAEHIGQVFDPYFTTKSAGTGLGLAIVHKIVEGHGGRIHVESSRESGTRFTLSIPCGAPGEIEKIT